MSQKYNFEAERNPIISLRGQRRCQTKGNNERTPNAECGDQYFQHQICQLGRDSKYDKWFRGKRIMAC